MVFTCKICDIKVGSSAMFDCHLQGRRHSEKLKNHRELEQIASRSIFLSKFNGPTDVQTIEQSLRKYGELDRVILDKQNHSFAIVEFKEPEVAQNLIHHIKTLDIGNSNVGVSPRKTDFGSKLFSIKYINSIYAIECLKLIEPGFSKQLDCIIAKFIISQPIINERKQFADDLSQFLQRFFSFPVNLRIFGSTSTNLAFLGSDLDLNFSFEYKESELCNIQSGSSSPSSSTCSTPSNGDQQLVGISENLNIPISKELFLSMRIKERLRHINKIINAYRKDTGSISSLVPVHDAKCPVIRFYARKINTFCEISIQNTLGELKANFIKDVLNNDISGNLRRLLLLFKFWAQMNSLFFDDSNPTSKTHIVSSTYWNSYTLSLLIISYFQSISRIPPFEFRSEKKCSGWSVDYSVPEFDLGDLGKSDVFKNMLIHCYNILNENKVLSVKDGCIYSKTEFQKNLSNLDQKIYSKWKFSLVNIQDPIELSHNVSANVSKHFVSMFRWKLMYSISCLKNQPEEILYLFELPKSASDASFLNQTMEDKFVLKLRCKNGLSQNDLIENISSIFEDVLLFECLEEPEFKRQKDDTFKSLHREMAFSANFPVWKGRRPLRRQLLQSLGNLSPLELEREVSKELRYRSKTADNSFSSCSAKNDIFKFSLKFKHLEADLLHCCFFFCEEQKSTFGQDFLHFISTFLPKFLSDIAIFEFPTRKNLQQVGDVDRLSNLYCKSVSDIMDIS